MYVGACIAILLARHIYLPTYLSICPSIDQAIHQKYLSIYLPVYTLRMRTKIYRKPILEVDA